VCGIEDIFTFRTLVDAAPVANCTVANKSKSSLPIQYVSPSMMLKISEMGSELQFSRARDTFVQSCNGLRDKLCGSVPLQRQARRFVSKQCLVTQAKVAISDESDRTFTHEFAPVQGIFKHSNPLS
jgi:hypothetical protein